MLAVRRTHFASICLMLLASSIAITEYISYVPVPLPESVDDESVSDNGSLDENSEETTAADAEAPDEEGSEEQLSSSVQTSEKKTEVDLFRSTGEKEIVISRGDTITSAIGNLGFAKTDVHLASKALSKVFKLKNLKIGQKIAVRGKYDKTDKLTLMGFEFHPDYRYKITVSRNGAGFRAEKSEVAIKKVVKNISGQISPKSPRYSLKKCGVKSSVAAEALRGLSHVVNLRASKRPADFEFLYQDFYDEFGNVVKKSELLYASICVNGQIKRVYKFVDNGTCEYVDSNGVILKTLARSRSMLSQPLAYTKVTSHFGLRVHPISRKVKKHEGVDFKAAVGTPVRAAASGVVVRASPYSGYGRYINIRHSASINTAYAHLSRIVVRSGQHVAQGQIIGYTGNSGITTGCHLHYEVHENGRPINPMSFVKQAPLKLTGEKLRRFNRFKRQVNMQVVGLIPAKGKTAKVKRFS
ncbi:MAG: M23 family metallopeptidase [Alphaproteobacteria bacterium]|nr:M23 family metallopeptidase [Alphaproteobacteria bacterium]